MRLFCLLSILLLPLLMQGQFRFEGQVAQEFANRPVYISLVEDYRKTTRVYQDQIIQKTETDTLGRFYFTGNYLPPQNRIYTIAVDNCTATASPTTHLLSACAHTVYIPFIANNRDTIILPLNASQQSFCQINASNKAANHLLQLENLKEEMVVSIIDQPTPMAKTLKFRQWIKSLQSSTKSMEEPLAELYAYSFISDRENETYPHYLEVLEESPYYTDLAKRLKKRYPNTAFTQQFAKELLADQTLLKQQTTTNKQNYTYLLLGVAIGLGLHAAFFGFKRWQKKRKRNITANLSPQERKVLQAILEGKSNKEIAATLFISPSTVKSHINSLYKKLGKSSRAEILAAYQGKTLFSTKD